MPRRSTPAKRPAPAAKAAPAAQPPAPVHAAPPAPVAAAPQQPGMFAQMASTAAGVAVGSTVGHLAGNAISGLFGGSSAPAAPQTVAEPVQQQQQVNACEPDQKAFMKCLETNGNEISNCQFYLDMLKQCQNTKHY